MLEGYGRVESMSEPLLSYFAYGSNLWEQRLQLRVPSARFAARASLPCFALRFHKRGRDGSAKADAFFTGRGTDTVHGVVYAMAARDLGTLDRIEGGYVRASVLLDSAAGGGVAFTYLAAEPRLDDPRLLPFDWYLGLVLEGARAHRLPVQYLRALERQACAPDPDPRRRHDHLALA